MSNYGCILGVESSMAPLRGTTGVESFNSLFNAPIVTRIGQLAFWFDGETIRVAVIHHETLKVAQTRRRNAQKEEKRLGPFE